MSVAVKFWTFGKRENSTARPNNADAVTYNCHMKDSVTITNPVIQLGLGASENPTEYNYARIGDFNRYYFISDWTANGNIWEASLVCDVLATYKNEIGNSTEYVMRSASNYDLYITDTLYPLKPRPTIQHTEINRNWAYTIPNGNFVVGIINNDDVGIGGVSYYAMTLSELLQLQHKLLGDITDYGTDWGDIGESALKAQFDPSQYIKSIMWYPFPIPAGSAVDELPLGWWDIDISTNRISLSPSFTTFNFTVPISKHPQRSRGFYLDSAPYSRYALYFSPFGTLPIDANVVSGVTSITATVRVDFITGMGHLRVIANNAVIAEETASIGVPLAISQISRNYVAAATSLLNAGIQGFTGNFAGAVSGIGNAAQSLFPQAKSTGSPGNTAIYSLEPMLVSEFYPIVDEDIEHRGRPLMQKVKVNTLSGYLVCADGDIALPSTQEENVRVKSYLEGGFFYE